MKKNKKLEHKKILENEAIFNNEHNSSHCENCSNPLLFGMEDKYHKFSLGLLTILDCLRVAEKEGYIPPLSDDWWLSVHKQYNLGWPPR